MQQSRVMALPLKLEQTDRGANVRGERLSQVRIEIRQTGTVEDEIEPGGKPPDHFRSDSQSGLRNISLDHLDPLAQEIHEPFPVAGIQAVKGRGSGDDFFKPLRPGMRPLPANQQVDSPYLREIGQQVNQPYLPDKPGYANEEDLLAGQRFANR